MANSAARLPWWPLPEVSRGDPAVFARADSLRTREEPVIGYAGTLVDTWRGWAVPAFNRLVTEQIIVAWEAEQTREKASLTNTGLDEHELDRRWTASSVHLALDGDELVLDERDLLADPSAVTRIPPDVWGRYVVMGYRWHWQAISPHLCGIVIGHVPPCTG